MKFGFSAKRRDDPEKMVLPGIVFVAAESEAIKKYGHTGFGLAVGWWDWSAQLNVYWKL